MLDRSLMRSFVLVAGLPVAAFSQSAAGSPQREERALRSADASFLSAVGAHDIDKVAAMYAADAVAMNPGGPAVTGAGVRKSWMDLFALPGQTLTWTVTRVNVATSGDMASETGTYQLSYAGPDGRASDAGNFVTVWRKSGGQWKIVIDAAVSSTPRSAMSSPTTASPGHQRRRP